MKANKITLKKIRIEYLERIVDDIQNTLEFRRNRLDEAKEELERVMTELFDNDELGAVRQHERDVRYAKEAVDRYELEISEGEKILAELEKMV